MFKFEHFIHISFKKNDFYFSFEMFCWNVKFNRVKKNKINHFMSYRFYKTHPSMLKTCMSFTYWMIPSHVCIIKRTKSLICCQSVLLNTICLSSWRSFLFLIWWMFISSLFFKHRRFHMIEYFSKPHFCVKIAHFCFHSWSSTSMWKLLFFLTCKKSKGIVNFT